MGNRRSREYRVAVAGHLVYDEIRFPDGRISKSFGGIGYNLAAFCTVLSKGRIMPVCEIGLDRKEEYHTVFKTSPILDNTLIRITDSDTVLNRLAYDAEGNRNEWNSRVPEPLSLSSIPGDIDALLMNFISGDDVEPAELMDFRGGFDGLIYLDYHSLALGRSSGGARYLRKNPDWAEYAAVADILQLNLDELSTIVEKRISDPRDIADGCGKLHRSGPATVIVTLGKSGAVVSMDSGTSAWLVPSARIGKAVDATGCGDTLAAITLHNYLISGDILKSLIEGSLWAAGKATFSGIGGFSKMREIIDKISPNPAPVKL